MYIFLKLHIRALAHEAMLARHEAGRRLSFSRHARVQILAGSNRSAELLPASVTALSSYHELHHHRTVVVRHEARAAQLAYAFLRGRTLLQVECGIGETTCNPKWVRVLEIVHQYHTEDRDTLRQSLMKWLQEAGLNACKITGWDE